MLATTSDVLSANVSPYIILFYLLIGANYLATTFPCSMQRALQTNVLLKHVLGVMFLYFSVYMTTTTSNPYKGVLVAFGLYAIFLLTTRMTPWSLMTIFTIMFVILYLEHVKKYHMEKHPDDMTSVKMIGYAQHMGEVVVFVVLLIGVIMYLGEKSREYKKDWHWGKFIFGVNACKFKDLPATLRRDRLTDLVDGLKRLRP